MNLKSIVPKAAGLAAWIVGIIYSGFALSVLWGWFFVPLGVVPITTPWAIGIYCLALMNPLMILVKIIKLRWIHILSYDQMVSRKINNQTTRCANSIFYTTLFTNSAPNYT
ncbi:hypothetical protein ACN5SP_005161 [Escherichia coli]